MRRLNDDWAIGAAVPNDVIIYLANQVNEIPPKGIELGFRHVLQGVLSWDTRYRHKFKLFKNNLTNVYII